jgi:hypothetical protein
MLLSADLEGAFRKLLAVNGVDEANAGIIAGALDLLHRMAVTISESQGDNHHTDTVKRLYAGLTGDYPDAHSVCRELSGGKHEHS